MTFVIEAMVEGERGESGGDHAGNPTETTREGRKVVITVVLSNFPLGAGLMK
jgi:hypothetical protein